MAWLKTSITEGAAPNNCMKRKARCCCWYVGRPESSWRKPPGSVLTWCKCFTRASGFGLVPAGPLSKNSGQLALDQRGIAERRLIYAEGFE